jgi:Cysteine-rich CPXCG
MHEVQIECPSCGEAGSIEVDTSAGDEQSYVEDCWVCCRPMQVRVSCRPGEVLSLEVCSA